MTRWQPRASKKWGSGPVSSWRQGSVGLEAGDGGTWGALDEPDGSVLGLSSVAEHGVPAHGPHEVRDSTGFRRPAAG